MTTSRTTSARRNPIDALITLIAGRFGSKAKEVERFLKFAVVGVIGFVVDLGTLVILQATILPPTTFLAVVIATTAAFLAAIISNFIWNRFWTYPDSRSRSIRTQLIQFTFISVVGWLARTAWIGAAYVPLGDLVTPLVLPLLQWQNPEIVVTSTLEAKIGSVTAQIIGVVVVMFWNFFANRYWTYSDVDQVESPISQ
ncbi:MAG: GtrA family protein [Anaerolineae bacterium]|nr:GtrA family protein [Anaerolineae bacterium]